jgi:hypothetical protein
MAESDKVMFEIYREADYGRKFRVVYFTELTEHNKQHEIASAMAGEHVYDGFIKGHQAARAKEVIVDLLDRLNRGEAVDADQIEELLSPYAPA